MTRPKQRGNRLPKYNIQDKIYELTRRKCRYCFSLSDFLLDSSAKGLTVTGYKVKVFN